MYKENCLRVVISPPLVKENHHSHAVRGYLVFICFVVLDNLYMKILSCYMTGALSPGMGYLSGALMWRRSVINVEEVSSPFATVKLQPTPMSIDIGEDPSLM